MDLSGLDLSDVIGAFCCSSNEEKNLGRKSIHFYLDDVQYQTDDILKSDNNASNILESDYHLLQFFGDVSARNTNLFESAYNGGVFSGETRFIFPRFSKIFDSAIPIPDPFLSGTLASVKDITWEDRFDYGVGLEWRPFSKTNFLEGSLLSWVSQLRFYALYLGTKYMQYQSGWDWRPKADSRYGVEFYNEYNLYNTDRFWSEIWADASWRKTDFYVDGYDSWTFSMVPKLGIKLFSEEQCAIMPYLTCEIDLTRRSEFWQNRALLGGGIRMMPFRWNESMMNVIVKGLRVYVEGWWVVDYFADVAPPSTPHYDLRTGIDYTINWW